MCWKSIKGGMSRGQERSQRPHWGLQASLGVNGVVEQTH